MSTIGLPAAPEARRKGLWREIGASAATARRLGRELLGSRLLLAYVALGLLSGLGDGPAGMGRATGNYLLLAIYVLIINRWTRDAPTLAAEAARGLLATTRRRDLAVVAALFLANMGMTAWFWAGGAPVALLDATRDTLRAAGWQAGLASALANGLVSSLMVLLPASLVLALARVHPRQIALRPRYLGLAVTLIGIGVGLAGLLSLLSGRPITPVWGHPSGLPLALGLFAAQFLINGLPEEFLFRGVMLTRLVGWLRHPHHALALTSILFVAAHVPSLLAAGSGVSWWLIVGKALVSPGAQPTGLVWAYLAYRTGSIWPGALWHASFLTLGVLFL